MAATGEPIMCAMILEGEKMKGDWVTGIDMFAEEIGSVSDRDYYNNNSGKGKVYPGGPTCNFQGKEVPCVFHCSPNGSITSQILANLLEKLDQLEVFPRIDGVRPFLLLDGHGSRLELPFLNYINCPNHEWVVFLGVPYGTSYWQVGDSSEQNGSYKMAITKAKAKLVDMKIKKCIKNPRVEKDEIVLVVNQAWNASFARVEYNKKAIAARGWNPLTFNLLDNPEICGTMTEEDQ